MKIGHSEYHRLTYSPKGLARCAKRVVRELKQLQKKLKFDAIAFRGSSGAAIAYPISVLGGFELIFVRSGRSHHGEPVEGTYKNVKRYVILDDFIGSGATVMSIVRAIKSHAINEGDYAPECVAICLYDGYVRERDYDIGDRRKEVYVPVYSV
jgi:orotate phosphoribosyltransferase